MFPIPQVNDDNRAFWTGGRDGELQIVRCNDCGYYIHPPSPRCPRCLGDDVEPHAVSGRGVVYTYTVNRREWSPGLAVPYVIAIVQLDEQSDLRLMTNIVNCPAESVAIGMRVRVRFEPRDDVWIPLFEPVGKRPHAARSEPQASGVEKGASGERANPEPGGKDSLASPEL